MTSPTANELLEEARASLPQRLTPEEAAAAMRDGALLIDIRDGDQRRADGLIPGAIIVQRNSLEWRCDPSSGWHLAEIADHDARLVLICNQGFQSSLAAATLQRLGLHNATDVKGGFQAWVRAGAPVIPPHDDASPTTGDVSRSSDSAHWDDVYATKPLADVSWYQRQPVVSRRLLDLLGVASGSSVLDVGGGGSALIASLAAEGWRDLSVLDISHGALEALRTRLGVRNDAVELMCEDVRTWRPRRRYEVWHDRAVLHFLVGVDERMRYLDALSEAVAPGGAVIIGVFGEDGPSHCSGLPVLRYSVPQLTSFLGEEFSLIDSRREEHWTPRGSMQRFQWTAFRRA